MKIVITKYKEGMVVKAADLERRYRNRRRNSQYQPSVAAETMLALAQLENRPTNHLSRYEWGELTGWPSDYNEPTATLMWLKAAGLVTTAGKGNLRRYAIKPDVTFEIVDCSEQLLNSHLDGESPEEKVKRLLRAVSQKTDKTPKELSAILAEMS